MPNFSQSFYSLQSFTVLTELCPFIPFPITLKITCLDCLQTNINGHRLLADQMYLLKNISSAGATNTKTDNEIKYWLRFATETDGWKKQRLERHASLATCAAPS